MIKSQVKIKVGPEPWKELIQNASRAFVFFEIDKLSGSVNIIVFRFRRFEGMKALIERFLEHLRVERNASAHTIRSYASDLEQFRNFLWSTGLHRDEKKGDVSVEKIDHLAIRAYLSHLYRGHKKSSLARKLAAQRSFFRYLVEEGVLAAEPRGDRGHPEAGKELAHLPARG